MFTHVDVNCYHGGNDWGSFTWVGEVSAPLVENDEIHVDKSTRHEDELWYSECEEVSPFRLPEIVVQFEEKPKHHVNNSEDDSHFHFETVSELHLICWHFPDWVNSYRIHTTCERFCRVVWTWIFYDSVAAAENTQVESKKLVVNETAISHEEDDHPKPNISFEKNKQRNG